MYYNVFGEKVSKTRYKEMVNAQNSDGRRNTRIVFADASNRGQHFVLRCPLQKVGLGSSLQTTVNEFIAGKSGQQNDFGCRIEVADSPQCGDSVQLGHPQVQEGDIRAMTAVLFDCRFTITGFRHRSHVILTIDEGGQSLTHYRKIIRHQHALGPFMRRPGRYIVFEVASYWLVCSSLEELSNPLAFSPYGMRVIKKRRARLAKLR